MEMELWFLLMCQANFPSDSLFHRDKVTSLLGNVSIPGLLSGHTRQEQPASKLPCMCQDSRHRKSDADSDCEEGEESQTGGDSDDDDDFETDRRPLKISNAPSSSTPRPRQLRKEYKENIVATAASGPAKSATTPPSSCVRDLAEIEELKKLARSKRRLQRPRPNQRLVWSECDSKTLITLVASRAAGWADMEKKDGHLFDVPRDAQAYRNKARNIKVDFLKFDAVLPLGFDLVILNKKERNSVQNMGKNPAREEADVDRSGRPTNTKYIPDSLEDS